MKKTWLFGLLLLLVLLAACGGTAPAATSPTAEPTPAPPAFDLRGAWSYTLTETSTGNTYDAGTLNFTGEVELGVFQMVNLYAVEYSGNYLVSGAQITLGMENFAMTGTFENTDRVTGQWEDPGNQTSGTFEMLRSK